jgi:uncharacterized protein YjbI with pentapeptide repeats
MPDFTRDEVTAKVAAGDKLERKDLRNTNLREANLINADLKDNATKATLAVKVQNGGLFKMAENLFAKQMEKQVSTDMDSLKRVMGT